MAQKELSHEELENTSGGKRIRMSGRPLREAQRTAHWDVGGPDSWKEFDAD